MPRDTLDWTSGYSGELFAGRGFTGHEHLTEFSLINMNGRVYDPILGRLLSPDPYVQSPAYPNNFNRYAYALNNPLRFIDPSGYKYGPTPDERDKIKEGVSNLSNWYWSPLRPEFHSGADAYFKWYNFTSWMNTFLAATPDEGKLEVDYNTLTAKGYRQNITSGVLLEDYSTFQEIFISEVGGKLYSGGSIPASNNMNDQFSWANDNSPLVDGSGSSLRGVGGELGFDVLGSRLMVGVHIYTNEYKSAYNGGWKHTHEKYSGFNLAFGPFKLQLRYNWTNSYFENGFGLSFVNIQQNSRPTLSGISGTAYLFGGLSGGVNFDAGSVMKTATEASKWYYKNTGKPWMVSFH